MTNTLIAVAIAIAAGCLSLLLPERRKCLPVIAGGIASFAFVAYSALPVLIHGAGYIVRLGLGYPFDEGSFLLDPLAALFALIAATGGLLAPIYSVGYMKSYEGKQKNLAAYWCWLPILTASILLVVTSRNALFFLVAWELMSLSSFFLASFDAEKQEIRESALYYLLAMQVGVAFIICAFVLLYSASGHLDFTNFATILVQRPELRAPVFLLLLAGFGTKAGLVPFHGWLPKAHPAAPSPVSSLMSGVMIKTGIYGILRFASILGGGETWMALVLLALAGLTALYGVIQAQAQRDIKRLLAWSTVENAGIIGIGIGLGLLGDSVADPIMSLLGYGGALLHSLNHFFSKSALFYGAGAAYRATGTRDLERLGGLGKKMPISGATFAAGSASISGLPPFGCFIGEFLMYMAAIHGALGMANPLSATASILSIGVLALSGAISVIAFTKATGIGFFGLGRAKLDRELLEVGPTMYIPMIILVALSLAIGLFPNLVLDPILSIAGKLSSIKPSFVATGSFAVDDIRQAVSMIGLVSALVIGGSIALFGIRCLLVRGVKKTTGPTWSCGYRGATPRIQYTAYSYSSPLSEIFGRLIALKKTRRGEEGLFPTRTEIDMTTSDIVDTKAVKPIAKGFSGFLGLFSWMQSGFTQKYITYLVVFLVAAILFLVGVGS